MTRKLFWLLFIVASGGLVYYFRKELGLEGGGSEENQFTAEKALSASLVLNTELEKKVALLTTDLSVVQNSNVIAVLAGESIPNERVVVLKDGKAYLYNVSNPLHINLQIGFAKTGGSADDLISITLSGKITSVQALTINSKYYVGAGGTITTTAPVSNILQSVGFAISSSELILDFSQKIAQ